MALGGHLWTIGPRLQHAVRAEAAPEAKQWKHRVDDPVLGAVPLSGLYRERREGRGLLVVLHGLGGCATSYYALRAAKAADDAGLSCLRLNLRGADGSGEDFYHAGLTEDLVATLDSVEARSHEPVFLLGFSLGGHLAVRYACMNPDRRVKGVAAVSSPLDLAACADWIDRPGAWIYRRYLLHSLVAMSEKLAAKKRLPCPIERVREIDSIRAFDDAVVAPRHGFTGAADYYAKASAGPLLGELKIPSLLMLSREDPMVPPHAAEPYLNANRGLLDFRWTGRGGHVGMPRNLAVGIDGAPLGAEGQAIGWLLSKASMTASGQC